MFSNQIYDLLLCNRENGTAACVAMAVGSLLQESIIHWSRLSFEAILFTEETIYFNVTFYPLKLCGCCYM